MINYKDKCYYVSSEQLHESVPMQFHVAVAFADTLEKRGHTQVCIYKGQLAL
jgi:hypothetical protein